MFRLILMPASSRPEPPLKQRFEFKSPGAHGSGWATDWPKAVRGLNELVRAAGVPCAETPDRFLAEARKAQRKTKSDVGFMERKGLGASPLFVPWRAVPLGSLCSPSFHSPPRDKCSIQCGKETDLEEKIKDIKENI